MLLRIDGAHPEILKGDDNHRQRNRNGRADDVEHAEQLVLPQHGPRLSDISSDHKSFIFYIFLLLVQRFGRRDPADAPHRDIPFLIHLPSVEEMNRA